MVAQHDPQDGGPLAFFRAQAGAFAGTLAERRERDDLLDGLLGMAFDSFDGNVAIQAEGEPPLACHKGCAACCTLRVTATAPEVLLIGRYIAQTAAHFLGAAGIDLPRRVAECDARTRGLGEEERVALRCRCAFIAGGVCTIYPVRPLACRGHASYDKHACADAAAGRADAVPHSEPHRFVRAMVQGALQSSLRDAGMPWGLYELNHALQLALTDPACSEGAWRSGVDVFAAAAVDDLSAEDMARTFDQIKTLQ